MPRPSRRSRTLARVYKKVTKGVRLVYKKRKPKAAKCNNCGAVLKGIPRERPYKMSNMPKSQKRPERMFGGVLCSKCARREIIKRNRK
ncbi:50S ribosomal protein L34e [Candidatus Woesearchaeota archaeon]|nr:50S ribosomal protein L34e [Candidatus Woesearchaeota archaeon]